MSYSGTASKRCFCFWKILEGFVANGGWIHGPLSLNTRASPTLSLRWWLGGSKYIPLQCDRTISAPRWCLVTNFSFSPDSSNFFWPCLPGQPLVCKSPWGITLNGPKKDTKLTFTHYIHIECVKKNTPLHTPFRKDINSNRENISRGAPCISLLSCNGNIIDLVCVASNFIFSFASFSS